MNNSTDQSECVNSKPVPTRSRWKFGQAVWILIAGLILLNIGVVFGTVDWNKRSVSLLIHKFDPRYWSLHSVPILWGIVCWLATDFACRFEVVRQKRYWIKFIIVFGTFCIWTGVAPQTWAYYNVYVPYVVGPISNYLVTGFWDWKILIAPVMAVVVIAFLLYVAVKCRRPKL
ncbi:hypothetical protein FACS189443_5580 [Planctomycetales bacterium]|nr:hypothetical protein FACS189443_5580 [Planctomycetales bacterium]